MLGVKVAERGGGMEEGAGWCNSDTMFVSFSLWSRSHHKNHAIVPRVFFLYRFNVHTAPFRSLFTSFL